MFRESPCFVTETYCLNVSRLFYGTDTKRFMFDLSFPTFHTNCPHKTFHKTYTSFGRHTNVLTVNYFELPQCKTIRHYLIYVIILQDRTAQYFGCSARTINFATTLFAIAHHLQSVLGTSLLRHFILMLPFHLFESSGRFKNVTPVHQTDLGDTIIIIIIIIIMS